MIASRIFERAPSCGEYVTMGQVRYGAPSTEKALGALPVVAAFCRRLDLAGIVARAGQRRFLLVGDSKLVSYPNLAAISRAEVTFIAPASKTYVGAAVLAALDVEAAAPVDYIAQRDTKKNEQDRGSYRVVEDTMILTGPKTAEPDLHLRRVFGWSSARAGAAAKARAKKLDRACGDLERLGRGLGGRYYPTANEVTDSGPRTPC